MLQSTEKFVPKNGHTLRVIGVCRISTVHQDEESLTDQEALYHTWLRQNVSEPYDLHVISGQGSGESLNRAEYTQLVEQISTGEFDLVLCEDLGRICRRVHAHLLCEEAGDFGTRVIALNDHVDTGVDGWQNNSFFAVMRHEAYNRDTAKRIRRSLRNRFTQGGVVQTLPYGYIKPHSRATDEECTKDPTAVKVYEEWFRRLEEGQSFAEIADWLNQSGIPTGPACWRKSKWDGSLVGTVTRNPLLKGIRQRNRRKSIRKNSSGIRATTKAEPEELLQRSCPHLAFIEAERYDRVIRMLTEKNQYCHRKGVNGRDPRANVPRKRTRWPGQHLTCGLCGRVLIFGGNGSKDYLACHGSQEHLCWNVVSCHFAVAARSIAAAVLSEIENWPDYDGELVARIQQETTNLQAAKDQSLKDLKQREIKLARDEENLRRALREYGPSPLLQSEMTQLEREKKALRVEQDQVERQHLPKVELPQLEELRTLARVQFQKLALESEEFGRLMRRLIPRIDCYAYEPLDGGRPVLRAAVTLHLGGLLNRPQSDGGFGWDSLTRIIVVDLFEMPQRIRFREQILDLVSRQKQREVAQTLGVKQPVITNAINLTKRMVELGRTDPYYPVRQPIEHGNRYRRHKHPRFRHSPLPGYETPKFPTE
ncbi:recombinase family protein [Planctomicrobium sp. SH527]|uniref:recombinase family protein n=1 Tax=Planctomicrobium sp. SH527 TaxID=3448123 RepID=UPI003F5CAAC8